MAFADRFVTLIHICRAKNADIARGTATDPSLVSRWRTGDREPADIPAAARSLGKYFASLKLLDEDRKQLYALLALDPAREEQLPLAVETYLAEEENGGQSVLSPGFTGGLFGSFESILEVRDPGGLLGVSFFPYVKTGMPSEHELFLGPEGQRRAALNFFHLVISSRAPLDVYLMNNAGDRWINEDKSFLPLWQKGLSAMARAEHRLHILLPGMKHAVEALKDYLPVLPHARADFFALEADMGPVPSLFLARGAGALFSFGRGDGVHTLFFKNPTDGETFFELLTTYLEHAVPVFTFASDTQAAYLEKTLQLEERPGPMFTLRRTFPAVLLPDPPPPAPGGDERILPLLQRRRECFDEHIQKHVWCEFISTDALTQVEKDGRLTFPAEELPGAGTLSREESCRYIERVIWLLESEPNFHLYLTDTPTKLTLFCKPESGVMLINQGTGGQIPNIRVEETALVASVLAYTGSLFESMQKNGVRKRTVERMKELLAFIRGDFGEGYLEI
ncbi:hypothetical protein LJC32_06345 [Oscillospiraceae bacterium OttesenSCG-928-F05]|nr:hypothetical protein [Oscillospiraceae bacterium OttesenSCG-928-F05]